MKVKSSNLLEIKYNKKKKILSVVFVSGSLYEYYDVPEEIFKQLQTAKKKKQSLGSLFFTTIVKSNFAYKNVG